MGQHDRMGPIPTQTDKRAHLLHIRMDTPGDCLWEIYSGQRLDLVQANSTRDPRAKQTNSRLNRLFPNQHPTPPLVPRHPPPARKCPTPARLPAVIYHHFKTPEGSRHDMGMEARHMGRKGHPSAVWKSVQQTDGTSCGIFVIARLIAITRG